MHRPRRISFLGLLAALVIVLAACSAATSSPDATEAGDGGGETGETVSLAGGAFSPTSLTIAAGTTVTFTDTAGHTVTQGSDGTAVDDPIVDEEGGADPIEVTFDEAGTFDITCRTHPVMNMTVTVEG